MNISQEEADRLASILGCKLGTMPFTYLGLPMGTTRPTFQELMPLVHGIERRLSATSCFLNQGSRLQLLQSVLTSMPIYFLCTLAIPPGIIKLIERIQRQCLWRGSSDNSRQSLAAWNLVCLPKNKGGLGVLNLKVQNEALLLKFLHKFYNHHETPWVSLIWDSYYSDSIPHTTSLCGSIVHPICLSVIYLN